MQQEFITLKKHAKLLLLGKWNSSPYFSLSLQPKTLEMCVYIKEKKMLQGVEKSDRLVTLGNKK